MLKPLCFPNIYYYYYYQLGLAYEIEKENGGWRRHITRGMDN